MGGPVVILSKREIEKLRTAGQFAASLLERLGTMARPGVTTQQINDEAELLTQAKGARSAPLGYKDYPRSICTSVNEVVCHGIPSKSTVLKDGDIISIDVTPILDEYYGDTCRTFFVGTPTDEAKKLVEVTEKCMYLGIEAVRPGGRVGDIGAAIEPYAKRNGFSVVRDFVGHGVGKTFHGPPQVYHYRPDRRGMRLRAGMAFTIEPMINAGTYHTKVLEDDWTAVTRDGRLSAQFEHTIVVTPEGADILTRLDS